MVGVAEGTATVTVTATDPDRPVGGAERGRDRSDAEPGSRGGRLDTGSEPRHGGDGDAGGVRLLPGSGRRRAHVHGGDIGRGRGVGLDIGQQPDHGRAWRQAAATVTVTATDPDGLAATQSAAVAVQMPNRAPETVGSIPAQSLDPGRAGDAGRVRVLPRSGRRRAHVHRGDVERGRGVGLDLGQQPDHGRGGGGPHDGDGDGHRSRRTHRGAERGRRPYGRSEPCAGGGRLDSGAESRSGAGGSRWTCPGTSAIRTATRSRTPRRRRTPA